MSSRYQNNGQTLWMGDIDENMNEVFIRTSFNLMNANPTHVKVVRNKTNGQPMGYGFISFESEEMAQKVLRDLNGKQMPNANGKKFRLNTTSIKEEEYSIYVGDLSPEVNDHILFNSFGRHFPSVCSAKVMVSEGQSRRFGFVRFSDEAEYRKALAECDKSTIVGSHPISVRAAKPRRQRQFNQNYNHYKNPIYETIPSEVFVPSLPQTTHTPQPEVCEGVYSQEMNPYYTGVTVSGHPVMVYPMIPLSALPVNYDNYGYGQQSYGQQAVYYPSCDVPYTLMPGPQLYVDHGHNQFVDSDKLNDDMIAKNEDLYSTIESTRWSSPIDAEKETKMQ